MNSNQDPLFGSPQGAEVSSLPPLFSILAMLWQRRILILLLYALLGSVSLAVVYFWPDTYKSQAVILVDSQKIPDRLVATTVNAELQDRIATISKQILSSKQLLRIIDDFALYKDKRATLVQEELIEKMRGDIEIRLDNKDWVRERPGAFTVAYKGPSPGVVAAVATRLSNLFIEENLKSREVEAEGTTEFLRSRLQDARLVLDEQEQKIRKYKEEHTGELPAQALAADSNLGRLQQQLQGTQDLLIRAQESKRVLESSLGSAESSLGLFSELADQRSGEGGVDDPLAAERRKQEELVNKLSQLRVTYSESHPDVRATKALLASTTEAIRVRSKTPPSSSEQAASASKLPVQTAHMLARERERIALLKSQIVSADVEIRQREAERKRILTEIATLEQRVGKIPEREQEVSAMMRDYETSQLHYRSLLDKLFAAETSAEMERRQKAERFTVLDAARIPEKPYSPRRPLLLAVGAGVSVVLAIGICLLWELRKNRIMGEWELPADVNILGRIPYVPDPGKVRTRVAGPLQAMAAVCGALVVVCVTAVQIYTG